MKAYFSILVIFVLTVSCAHEPSIREIIVQRPIPANAQERERECGYIMSSLEHVANNTNKIGDKLVFTSKAIYEYYDALNIRYHMLGCKALPIIQFIEDDKNSSTDE